ncbi:MAG: 5-oxoprolinase subunit PxpB [Anaerolineae bacterium]
MADLWHFAPLGEAALLAQAVVPDIDLANRYALALSRAVEAESIAGLEGVVPGIDSVLVRFDPLVISRRDAQARIAKIAQGLAAVAEPVEATAGSVDAVVGIPVEFGGEAGPDLDAVAEMLGLSSQAVVAALCARPWRVMMIGFAQGFPYLGPLPPALHVPRRDTPRARVPAGSVAIAAGMVGIYPAELPGGWHIIGRTALRLFDPLNESRPALLQAGDEARFVMWKA